MENDRSAWRILSKNVVRIAIVAFGNFVAVVRNDAFKWIDQMKGFAECGEIGEIEYYSRRYPP